MEFIFFKKRKTKFLSNWMQKSFRKIEEEKCSKGMKRRLLLKLNGRFLKDWTRKFKLLYIACEVLLLEEDRYMYQISDEESVLNTNISLTDYIILLGLIKSDNPAYFWMYKFDKADLGSFQCICFRHVPIFALKRKFQFPAVGSVKRSAKNLPL